MGQRNSLDKSLAKVAYLLLCHKNAERVLEQAKILTAKGDCLAIHIDKNAGASFFETVKTGVADNPSVILAKRVACGWGEWSLIEASLNMIKAALNAFGDATHFFLMSGDCMPIKPAHVIHSVLDSADQDQIEHADFYKDDWIKTGMKEDRLIYRHWFNERSQKKLFYGSLEVQRKLGLSRALPDGIRMRIGSQWWVLRRDTIEKIMSFLAKRRDVMRFFKTTWIPDETFFQTLVMHLVPRDQVISKPPTLLMFSDYGMPVTFHGDHFDMLRAQDALFARKVSNFGSGLRAQLGALFTSDETVENTGSSGGALYDYVRRRGRAGRRFGSRIWDAGAVIGPDFELNLIVCKKWHVANRLVETLKGTGSVAFGYAFDQDDVPLPNLGNIESSKDKRGRHRRAFLKLLYQSQDTRKLTICLDPSNLGAIQDFASDGCQLRVLELVCSLSDDWLSGHAERIGLGTVEDQGDLHENLMTTLRQDIFDEQSGIRDLNLPVHVRVSDDFEVAKLARPLAEAFDVSIDGGAALARTPHLFED